MKILTVVFNLDKGGTQRAAQVFSEAYKSMNHDSRLLAVKSGGTREDALRNRGIPYWINLDEVTLFNIEQWKPDIVHLHSHCLMSEDVDKLITLKDKLRFKLVETNVFSIPSPWYKELDYVLQLSHWCDLIYRYELPNININNSYVISNPVDVSMFSRSNEHDILDFKEKYRLKDCFVLGRIGQNEECKWSLYLISIFEELSEVHKNIKLLLVNPPRNINDRAKKSHFNENIIIIDKIIGDHELSKAYSAIDLFVLISEKGESFGYVSVESLLCQTPIIALNTPWADNSQKEVIGSGGIVVNTIDELKNAIGDMIENENELEKIGALGRKHIIENYDSVKLANQLLLLIGNNAKTERIVNRNELKKKVLNLHRFCNFSTWLMVYFFKFRRMTRYTTGYDNYFNLLKRKVKKISNGIGV